jgi:hypothetical protein
MSSYITIKNFPNYEIGARGNIRNKSTKNLLKHYVEENGCCRVKLYISLGVESKHYVHRLVALTFLSKERGKHEVDHIDRNRSNNKLSNLKWANRSEQNYNKI